MVSGGDAHDGSRTRLSRGANAAIWMAYSVIPGRPTAEPGIQPRSTRLPLDSGLTRSARPGMTPRCFNRRRHDASHARPTAIHTDRAHTKTAAPKVPPLPVNSKRGDYPFKVSILWD
jgi:hypothetical protein